MNPLIIIFIILSISTLLITICNWYRQTINISGFVYNAESHERLINATVTEIKTNSVCSTNKQGHFSFKRKKGYVEIKISFNGYAPDTFHLKLQSDTTLICYLKTMGNK